MGTTPVCANLGRRPRTSRRWSAWRWRKSAAPTRPPRGACPVRIRTTAHNIMRIYTCACACALVAFTGRARCPHRIRPELRSHRPPGPQRARLSHACRRATQGSRGAPQLCAVIFAGLARPHGQRQQRGGGQSCPPTGQSCPPTPRSSSKTRSIAISATVRLLADCPPGLAARHVERSRVAWGLALALCCAPAPALLCLCSCRRRGASSRSAQGSAAASAPRLASNGLEGLTLTIVSSQAPP